VEHEKLTRLRRVINKLESAVVAFSGGVDSALLARLAFEELSARALAVTVVSPSMSVSERQTAIRLAEEIGIAHRLIAGQEFSDPHYIQNTPMRCYWCKRSICGVLVAYAKEHGYAWVIDGNNVDDLQDTRPGRQAASEFGVRSPFIEAGVTKADIRDISRHLGLSNWNKPALACLSTRIPYGISIDVKTLETIEKGEECLNRLGLHQLRLRHHGDIARIEVNPQDFSIIIQNREAIIAGLSELGYRFITLDLAGYQMGSFNKKVDNGK